MNFFYSLSGFRNHLCDIGILKGTMTRDSSRKLEIMYESVLIREELGVDFGSWLLAKYIKF